MSLVAHSSRFFCFFPFLVGYSLWAYCHSLDGYYNCVHSQIKGLLMHSRSFHHRMHLLILIV